MRRKRHREAIQKLRDWFLETRELIPDSMITDKVEVNILYVELRDKVREVFVDIENP